jgi:hypothetical protein
VTLAARLRTRCALSAIVAAALALTSCAALASPSSASAYTAGTSSDFFGVNGAMLRTLVPNRLASLDGLAASMGDQGISWARITFDQSVEERQRGTFNWYVPDTIVAALARHRVRAAANFVGTAEWADAPNLLSNCGTRAYPNDVPGWGDWVAAAARRYSSSGTFWAAHPELPKLPIQVWEIGNEPNSGDFWCPKANPEHYSTVYTTSANAITAVDPGAQVIVGGLAARFGPQTSNNVDAPSFLSRMIAANPSLRTSIPAVAIHPYAETVDKALHLVGHFRQAMAGAGMPSTPMLVNEIGWYTRGSDGPLKATELERADLIAGVANRFWRTDCGLSGLAPYSWVTMEGNNFSSGDWFGLASSYTGAPYPSGTAYGQQIRLALGQASSPPPETAVSACEGSIPWDGPEDPGLLSIFRDASSQAALPTVSPTSKKKCKKARKKRNRNRNRKRC